MINDKKMLVVSEGSPGTPDHPESTESDLGLAVTWNAPLDAGSSPLVSYILQYRQYDG